MKLGEGADIIYQRFDFETETFWLRQERGRGGPLKALRLLQMDILVFGVRETQIHTAPPSTSRRSAGGVGEISEGRQLAREKWTARARLGRKWVRRRGSHTETYRQRRRRFCTSTAQAVKYRRNPIRRSQRRGASIAPLRSLGEILKSFTICVRQRPTTPRRAALKKSSVNSCSASSARHREPSIESCKRHR